MSHVDDKKYIKSSDYSIHFIDFCLSILSCIDGRRSNSIFNYFRMNRTGDYLSALSNPTKLSIFLFMRRVTLILAKLRSYCPHNIYKILSKKISKNEWLILSIIKIPIYLYAKKSNLNAGIFSYLRLRFEKITFVFTCLFGGQKCISFMLH